MKQRVVLLLICLKPFLAIRAIKSLEMLHFFFFNGTQKIAAFKQNVIASKNKYEGREANGRVNYDSESCVPPLFFEHALLVRGRG